MARKRSAQTPPDLEVKLAGLRERYPVGRKYLVAVSGGRDSVVLLALLRALGYRRLVVCHANHGLRGRASGADAAWVRRLAAKWGVACHVERVGLVDGVGSVETAAREARYAFFDLVARRERCRRVFLAHHADDQVETVLMNLCRGTGVRGLGGMREEARRGRLELLRPLLAVWGEELETYAVEVGLRWREDASNASDAHTRNRVRRLVPQLTGVFGRDVRRAVWRAAAVTAEEDRWMAGVAAEVVGELVDGAGRVRVAGLRALEVALQRRVVGLWLRGQGVGEVGFEVVEAVRGLVRAGERRAKVNLAGGIWVRRREGWLFLQQ